MTVTAPGTSKSARLGRVTLCLAMMRCPTSRATRPTGPLIQKMNCQLAQVVMAPPTRTPAATPRLPTAPHRASAALRWAPAYVVVIRDERRGGQERGAEALDGAGGDELGAAVGEPADQRGDREEGQAGQEDASS